MGASKTEVTLWPVLSKENLCFSNSFQKFLYLNCLKVLYSIAGSLGKINRKVNLKNREQSYISTVKTVSHGKDTEFLFSNTSAQNKL